MMEQPTNGIEGPAAKESLRGFSARETGAALFLPDLRGGGAQRVTVNLARGLAERGVAVDIVLARAEGQLLSQVPGDVRVVDLRARGVLASVVPLARYLRRARPPVLLSALDHANVGALLARRLSGVPTRVIIATHSVLSQRAANVKCLKARVYRILMRRCYAWADSLVAVSHGVADDVSRMTGIARTRVHVIYNPVVEPALFVKASQPLEHPWFQPEQPKVVLAVGNLSPWKDYGTLIRAFSILCKDQAVRLMILGEGGERAGLDKLVRKLGLRERVSLPGFVENPYPYMARAAALVLCSKWEALPTVLIEAVALHVPVVSTDCDYGPREILVNGKYGSLVPVGDVDALAHSLRRAITSGQPRIPDEALDRFRFETSLEAYLRILFGEKHA